MTLTFCWNFYALLLKKKKEKENKNCSYLLHILLFFKHAMILGRTMLFYFSKYD